MSLAAACAWSLLRSAAVALAAVVMSKGMATAIAGSRFGGVGALHQDADVDGGPGGMVGTVRPARTSRLFWALLLAPFLAPHLLVGYAYSGLRMVLLRYPLWNEGAYSLLLLLKFLPAAVVIRVFAPPSPVSPEAIHCQRLLRRGNESWPARASQQFAHWIWGAGRASIGAFSLVFLLAFQEFEIASLMGVTTGESHSPVSWPVWLFDAHAGGGLPISDSLRYALLPLACELVLLLPALVILPAWMSPGWRVEQDEPVRRGWRAANGAVIVLSALLLAGFPAGVVVREATFGLASYRASVPVLRDIFFGAASALASAVLACWLARRLLRGSESGRGTRWTVAALMLPGLLGPMVLSLLLLGLFQLPGFHRLSQSLVPVILALALFVFPRAFVVLAVTGAARRSSGTHCAWLLAQSPSDGQRRVASRLIDDLEIKGLFWSGVLVWYWAYWEMTPPALLAPPSAMSFSVLLYNFMHYGRYAVFSTMLLAAVAAPIAAIVILSQLRSFFVRLIVQ